jgi:hypothetical protein
MITFRRRSLLMYSETEESLYEQTTNTNIPMRWTAPECFRTRQFNELSDVFSSGELAWEVTVIMEFSGS